MAAIVVFLQENLCNHIIINKLTISNIESTNIDTKHNVH